MGWPILTKRPATGNHQMEILELVSAPGKTMGTGLPSARR
jgi:hypothetical protein